MAEITNFEGVALQADLGHEHDNEVDRLIKLVGERVRRAREMKGMPRRVVCEMSGVSPRYLAQLEAGDGNISIGLLKRVALALGHRLEWFISDDDPWTSEVWRVADLYRSATEAVRARVLEVLQPQSGGAAKAERVCLIGLRGAGKSTLGAMAGEALHLPFIELNREIHEQFGMPVNEILALYGQEGYRKLEAQAVESVVSKYDSVVLAVAGGIVSEPETFKALLQSFHTVWLRAQPEEHMTRVLAQGDTRPMAGNPAAMDELKTILRSREALYGQADAMLDTSGKPVEASLRELLQLIRSKGFVAHKDGPNTTS